MRFSDARIEQFIAEDVPSIDLTTEVLGIAGAVGSMEYFTREGCVLCGAEEAARAARKLGLEVDACRPSGTRLAAGESFLRVEGDAADLHAAWKVCLNLCDSVSAVATKAAQFVGKVHAVNPRCEVLVTRKVFPGAKDLLTKAVMTGGAWPHRMGLSETILIFDNHIKFMGGFDALLEQLPAIRRRCIEKKVFVEATADQAFLLAQAGVDGIQFDKVPAERMAVLVPQLRAIDPHLTLIAAGGVNMANCESYAAAGVDGIATTCLYSAKPVDMSVRMTKVPWRAQNDKGAMSRG